MDTFLVLADLSDNSLNIANYACSLGRQLKIKRLVLLHEIIDAGKDTDVYDQRMTELKNMASELSTTMPGVVAIDYRAIDAAMAVNLTSVIREENASLVVSDNMVDIADCYPTPVLIVPQAVEIKPVTSVVFACDFQKITQAMPVNELTAMLDDLHPSLAVLNVENEDSKAKADTPVSVGYLHEALEKYNPSYYNVANQDPVKGIVDFAVAAKASLVILVTKKHGFFDNLFHRTVTGAIASVSPVPLLILHEKTA
jgi:hypothetical protein